MRTFNQFEKEILNFMVNENHEIQDVCTITLFDKFCNTYLIEWDEETEDLNVCFPEKYDWNEVRTWIFNLIILLQYLDYHKYVGFFGANILEDTKIYNKDKYEIYTNKNPQGQKYEIFSKMNSIGSLKLRDKEILRYNVGYIHQKSEMAVEKSNIGKYIKYYANSTFFPTQTVYEFVNKGFRTEDDIKFYHTRQQTWIAIAATIVIGTLPYTIESYIVKAAANILFLLSFGYTIIAIIEESKYTKYITTTIQRIRKKIHKTEFL